MPTFRIDKGDLTAYYKSRNKKYGGPKHNTVRDIKKHPLLLFVQKRFENNFQIYILLFCNFT